MINTTFPDSQARDEESSYEYLKTIFNDNNSDTKMEIFNWID